MIELQERLGLAYLFIAHDLRLVEQICDRVAVMYLGRIVERGAAIDVLRNPTHPYTMGLVAAAASVGQPRGELRGIPGDPPDVFAAATGCAFQPRCQFGRAECTERRPLLRQTGAGARACHRPVEELW